MASQKPSIISKSIEEFTSISKILSTLPEIILSQIETAENSFRLNCTFRDMIDDKVRIYLPNTVTQITNFDDYIGIYCDELFFKIKDPLRKRNIEYIFIDIKEK